MATSTRVSSNRVSKQYTNIRNYAKVTKTQNVKTTKNVSAKKLQALSDIVNEEKPRPAPAPSQLKRKRCDEDEEGATAETENQPIRKVRLAVRSGKHASHELSSVHVADPSPSTCTNNEETPIPKRAKRNTPTQIPDAIEDLREIFKYFLKTFSIHLAHTGSGSPANLDVLLPTITRLYKKRNLCREDIQRILALFEIPVQSVPLTQVLLSHKDSPFKLVLSGIGNYATHLIEYSSDIPFDEKFLTEDYAIAIDTVWVSGRNKPHSFVHGPVEHYPLLAYEKGAQTTIRQEKASAVRDHVLNGARQRQHIQEPDINNLSISDTTEPTPSTKSRTLSLFDRVKAKQSLASLTSTPTFSELLRRHAIGRIADVIEILRMKQNQRINGGSNKMSLSMAQTMNLIKESLSVPMADEEVRICVGILAREVPGGWLKVVEIGTFQSVIVQGLGPRGEEVREMLKSRC